MKTFAVFVLGWYLIFTNFADLRVAHAQVQETNDIPKAAEVWRALLRLQTTATVLHTTAHPDDEDGGLLTWLSRNQGVRTGLLTLNRGQGGANLIGPELYDALGIVRTEELLQSGRYYGVDQFFTRVADFGFSKRIDETLEHWGQENVLREMVRVVRLYRPDVIVSRFQGKPRDGHGNHQTAGLMSPEAVRAAADPKLFPEHMAEGLRPWRVKKLYMGARVFGGARESEPYSLQIDVGVYDPLLGRSYREMARDGLSYQRSQGAGQTRAPRGASLTYLQLIESVAPKKQSESSLFDGLDTSITGLAKIAGAELNLSGQLGEIQSHVERALAAFDARRPWVVTPHLTAGLRTTRATIEAVRASSVAAEAKDHLLFLLGNKEQEFQDAANKSLGIVMDVLVDPKRQAEGGAMAEFFRSRETFTVAVPKQKFTITAQILNPSDVRIEPVEIALRAPEGWRVSNNSKSEARPLGSGEQTRMQFSVEVPENAEYTRPYFSRANELQEYSYTINQPQFANMPFAPPAVVGALTYQVDGVRLTMTRPAQTVFMDRPWGEQRRLLTIAPAISVTASPSIGVIPVSIANQSFPVRVSLLNNVLGATTGKVRLQAPQGWTVTPAETNFSFSHEDEVQVFSFRITPQQVTPGTNYKVQAVAEYDNRQYTEGYQAIVHRDLEPRHLYRPATIELRGVDVRVAPNLKIGYVMGVGDEVPSALEQMGVSVTMLGQQNLATGDLDQYDTILIGIRAYAVRDDLKAHNRRLLDYVERGGNLIVQYQTQEFDAAPYGPFSYKLGPRAEEVSEENAKVTILDPSNPVLNNPNKITEADFDNWVEERGSKFMSEWAAEYKPLFESHDREQKPQQGGMMQAKFGRGTYTYAAYSFYRQLPAGTAGGYRLFANLISLGKRDRPGVIKSQN